MASATLSSWGGVVRPWEDTADDTAEGAARELLLVQVELAAADVSRGHDRGGAGDHAAARRVLAAAGGHGSARDLRAGGRGRRDLGAGRGRGREYRRGVG